MGYTLNMKSFENGVDLQKPGPVPRAGRKKMLDNQVR
jgi:hypothetical protein